MGATHVDNAVVRGSDGHDVLLYIDAASAHNRSRKQYASLGGLLFTQMPTAFSKS